MFHSSNMKLCTVYLLSALAAEEWILSVWLPFRVILHLSLKPESIMAHLWHNPSQSSSIGIYQGSSSAALKQEGVSSCFKLQPQFHSTLILNLRKLLRFWDILSHSPHYINPQFHLVPWNQSEKLISSKLIKSAIHPELILAAVQLWSKGDGRHSACIASNSWTPISRRIADINVCIRAYIYIYRIQIHTCYSYLYEYVYIYI